MKNCRFFISIVYTIMLLLLYSFAAAEDLYYAQSQAGDFSGSSCANAKSLSSLTWGSGAGNIGPGDTLHLCGTITGTAGTVLISTGASGTSGNKITIKFETDAILQAPYLGTHVDSSVTGGAITIGHSFITVDGGTNGIIRSTANGTGLTYQEISTAIFIGSNGQSDVEVKNLNILNMYVRTPCLTLVGETGWGYSFKVDNAGDNLNIHNNIVTYADSVFVACGYSNTNNWSIHNNTIGPNLGKPLTVAVAYPRELSNVTIYNNHFFDAYPGWDPADSNHLNSVIFWPTVTSARITGVSVFNNYFSGSFGSTLCGEYGHISNHIQIDTRENGYFEGNIYNNLFIMNLGDGAPGVIGVWGNTGRLAATVGIYNNTIVGANLGNGIFVGWGVVATLKNNIIKDFPVLLYGCGSNTTMISNHNLVYPSTGTPFQWGDACNEYHSLADWQVHGFDSDTITTNPLINSNGTLQYNSPAINAGADLSAFFTTDKDGNTRSGAWDIGAYEYVGGSVGGGVTGAGFVIK